MRDMRACLCACELYVCHRHTYVSDAVSNGDHSRVETVPVAGDSGGLHHVVQLDVDRLASVSHRPPSVSIRLRHTAAGLHQGG